MLSPAFWDSSALVSLCVDQPQTLRARAWMEQFTIVAWWAARVEMHGAIARLGRTGELPVAIQRSALDRIEELSRTWIEIVPDDVIRDVAGALLDLYPLRVADSLQLAAALVWCRNQPPGRMFVCADDRLCDAAALAGFTVLRP